MRARHASRVVVGVWFAVALLATPGCGSSAAPVVAPTVASLGAGEQQALVERVVSASQLPGLRKTTRTLTRDDVVAEADLADLGETLDAAGFRGGIEHEYRGVSRTLNGVESQVLAFSSADGARAFGDYLSRNAGAFFGEPTEVKPMTVDGRTGWLFDPPACNCAGAEPLTAGAVQVGPGDVDHGLRGKGCCAHARIVAVAGNAALRPASATPCTSDCDR